LYLTEIYVESAEKAIRMYVQNLGII